MSMNVPETELTTQDKWHLQIQKHIQSPDKHLKWSKKERPSKIILAWNFFPKTLQYA